MSLSRIAQQRAGEVAQRQAGEGEGIQTVEDRGLKQESKPDEWPAGPLPADQQEQLPDGVPLPAFSQAQVPSPPPSRPSTAPTYGRSPNASEEGRQRKWTGFVFRLRLSSSLILADRYQHLSSGRV